MSTKTDLLLPTGRLVQGSLYEPQTTDAEGNPLIVKQGVNAGQARVNYFFAVAIKKGVERHWSETQWGALVWQAGHVAFPNGQTQSPSFAWKIKDGDSTIPNKAGKRPCDGQGFPGHWVVSFSSGSSPTIVNADGSQPILDKDFVNLGDFVQVFGNVSGNGSPQQPGVYLNHRIVAFRAYGERIVLGVDPKSVGFGNDELPVGASMVPPSMPAFNPQSAPAPVAPAPAYVPPIAAPVNNAPPYPQILDVPAAPSMMVPPSAPTQVVRTMTANARGQTYEQMCAIGWTDATLIQHGMMLP